MISVDKTGPTEWKVTVEGAVRTEHRVTVEDAYVSGLFPDAPPPVEKLLEASFQFLLEREPNTSILRSFELSVIERYFSDYRRDIQTRFRSGR